MRTEEGGVPEQKTADAEIPFSFGHPTRNARSVRTEYDADLAALNLILREDFLISPRLNPEKCVRGNLGKSNSLVRLQLKMYPVDFPSPSFTLSITSELLSLVTPVPIRFAIT